MHYVSAIKCNDTGIKEILLLYLLYITTKEYKEAEQR